MIGAIRGSFGIFRKPRDALLIQFALAARAVLRYNRAAIVIDLSEPRIFSCRGARVILMRNLHRTLTIAVFLGLSGSIGGQSISVDDPPKKLVPKQPTSQEVKRRESLQKYVFGLQCVKEDRFAEALKAFEEAGRLDPDATEVFKAQVPILLGMDRYADALGACQKVVALDPEDYAIWYVQAKVH